MNAIGLVDASGNNYYMQVGMIDLGGLSTGGGGDKYVVVLSDVVKDTSNGTKYIVTAWDGTDKITITTDDSSVKNLGGGDVITYSGDINNADVDVKSVQNCYVVSYDSGSGDISLVNSAKGAITSSYNTDKIKKDTTILYVDSDDGSGVASGEIERAFYYDKDFWTGGAIGSGTLTEDDAPNVTCFFDDTDYITLVVVDINRNITEW